ncbi:hypothetical protein MANI_030241 [Metarhizium anisopliae]|nr:hypothetical protein MANI_030241 [Metarhizium anisopliae]
MPFDSGKWTETRKPTELKKGESPLTIQGCSTCRNELTHKDFGGKGGSCEGIKAADLRKRTTHDSPDCSWLDYDDKLEANVNLTEMHLRGSRESYVWCPDFDTTGKGPPDGVQQQIVTSLSKQVQDLMRLVLDHDTARTVHNTKAVYGNSCRVGGLIGVAETAPEDTLHWQKADKCLNVVNRRE